MKTTPDADADTLGTLGQPIRDDKPKQDRLEHVGGDVYRNTRTGAMETHQPLPKPVWAPILHTDDDGTVWVGSSPYLHHSRSSRDEQCED